MKLYSLHEDISKTDFYDTYALIYAYQRDKNDKQIAMRLKEHLDYILQDHINQIGNTIINRLRPYDSDQGQYVIYSKYLGSKGAVEHDNLQISANKKISMIRELIEWAKDDNQFDEFTRGDGVWLNLAQKYLQLVNMPKSIDGMIKSIDQIYKLAHHGGPLADYFDEREWLEDALHTRSNATPHEITSKASSDVRQLVKSGLHGITRPAVTDLQKLATAVNRSYPDLHTTIGNSILHITGKAYKYKMGDLHKDLRKSALHNHSEILLDYKTGVPVEQIYKVNILIKSTHIKSTDDVPYATSQFIISINGGEHRRLSIPGLNASMRRYAQAIATEFIQAVRSRE